MLASNALPEWSDSEAGVEEDAAVSATCVEPCAFPARLCVETNSAVGDTFDLDFPGRMGKPGDDNRTWGRRSPTCRHMQGTAVRACLSNDACALSTSGTCFSAHTHKAQIGSSTVPPKRVTALDAQRLGCNHITLGPRAALRRRSLSLDPSSKKTFASDP